MNNNVIFKLFPEPIFKYKLNNFKELNKNYDTDSMKKINLAFQKHSKGY